MYFIGKFILLCVIIYVIKSAVLYFENIRREAELEKIHRKRQKAETEAKKESDNQKPSA